MKTRSKNARIAARWTVNLLTIVFVLAIAASAAFAQVYLPGGRLTLTSNTPVMTSDVSGTPYVYYVPYVGDNVTTANGTALANSVLTSQLTLTLNSYLVSGDIYDIFIFSNDGVLTLCTGPAWNTSTSRGTGTGSTQLTTLNGLWVNAVDISCANDTTAYGVNAKNGFYLGSVYLTSTGETSMKLKPSAVSGGTSNVLGLWNAYNRVRLTAYSRDNNNVWGYTTASWRAADNSTSNKITFIDGAQQSAPTGNYSVMASTTSNTVGAYIGLNEDSSTTTPNITSVTASAPSQSSATQFSVTESFYPSLGLHYVQAVEYSTGSTASFYGTAGSQQLMALTVQIDM
jgi:hypothetical protein